jgi:signal peptidase II
MDSFRRSTSFALLALVVAVSVAVDQASKLWIRQTLAPGTSFSLFGPVTITHVQNTGSVFGLGQGQVLIPTIGSVLVLTMIPVVLYRLYSHYKCVPSHAEIVCVGLIAGGAIGNLVDRLSLGYVTDFVYVRLFRDFYWPAFNVADACIVVATGVLVVLLIRRGVFDVPAVSSQ